MKDLRETGCRMLSLGQYLQPTRTHLEVMELCRALSESSTRVHMEVVGETPEGRELPILVVADPETQSGKAKKARQYGKRIVAERSFWPRVGVAID